jgi:ribonuclease HI
MSKYYVVREGKKPGIYNSRDKCLPNVSGFSWAKYKSFSNKEDAEIAFKESYKNYYEIKEKKDWRTGNFPFEKNSIAVDAACSWNPGEVEYQWIDLITWKTLFHKKYQLWTNNIWEFLALVHGLQYLQKNNSDQYLYSDSKHAINRVIQKKCKTKLEKAQWTERIFYAINQAEERLRQTKFSTKILKRHTSERGEIPADFGRK